MTKILILAVVVILLVKFVAGRWIWDMMKDEGKERRETFARARSLLEVAPSASREDIIEAHRRLIARVHPDRGGSAEQVHEANAARDLLLSVLPPS